MIHHFQFWLEQNKRLEKNFYEGKTWVYQTQKEIADTQLQIAQENKNKFDTKSNKENK